MMKRSWVPFAISPLESRAVTSKTRRRPSISLSVGCCGDGLSDRGCLDVGDVYPSAYSREPLFEQPVDRIAGGHLHVGHYGRCCEYVQCARTHEGGAVLLADLGGRCRGNSYFDIFCCHIRLILKCAQIYKKTSPPIPQRQQNPQFPAVVERHFPGTPATALLSGISSPSSCHNGSKIRNSLPLRNGISPAPLLQPF